MVFYRKYRPQTINDLDNERIRDTLFSLFSSSSAPHAFLFTGPKGLGKTSTARIIAKVVNCTGRAINEEPRTKNQEQKGKKVLSSESSILSSAAVEPCNQCEQCLSINNGTNMDILEIDAASNRGIDEIRDLKEKIRLSPLKSSKKVYIIDEVHMLTTEAFNALLKTLEEPPAHAMFVLCTTEPHKVPSTILSRCFHLSFHLATPEELVRSFQRIVSGENIVIENDALLQIAYLSEGGFRDGAKMLEEIVSLSQGKKITKELIDEKYKVSSITYKVAEMLQVFSQKDTKKGLEIIADLVEQGVDMKYFLLQLMEVLHENLLVQVGVKKNQESRIKNLPAHSSLSTEAHPSASKTGRQGQELSINEIKSLFELFSRANAEMKYAVLARLPLELAIIEWCNREETKTTSLSRVITKEPEETKAIKEEVGVTVSSLRKHVGDINKRKALYGEDGDKKMVSDAPAINATTLELLHAASNGEITKEWLDIFWRSLISEMKRYNHTVAGLLRGCTIKKYSENQLIIETSYKFHKERLSDMKTLSEMMSICKTLTGKETRVAVELKHSV